MEIRSSARRHGVADADMLHAVREATRVIHRGDSLSLAIGADAAGRMLEVIVADLGTDRERIIHAMPLRPKFERYL